ncbi:MAG: YdcH family protein [Rhodocyclaceae bacterium]|uniref:YdcH family protein n=1 Tax=Denitromonas sp. TaxID=2734609 RepID=UPI002AFE1EEF|nr:YdcH family protein [Denitromonas sp.]
MLDDFEDTANWVDTLAQLKAEHRDLDTAIAALSAAPPEDGLVLPRLKKRKLALKDRIAYIERMIDPPELA